MCLSLESTQQPLSCAYYQQRSRLENLSVESENIDEEHQNKLKEKIWTRNEWLIVKSVHIHVDKELQSKYREHCKINKLKLAS